MEISQELSTAFFEYDEQDNNITTKNITTNTELWWMVFENEKYLRHSLPWTMALIIVYSVVFVIGFIGNCMVICVVVFRPKMRTVTNMFIMNLAVADLFVIVFCLPPTLLSNIFKPWILGPVICKGVGYVQGVSVCASGYSLAAISVDRCKAIYRPMEQGRGLSKMQALFTVCLIWMIALLVTLPWAIIFEVVTSVLGQLPYCIENWENEQHGKIYFVFVNIFVCYSLPLVVITISSIFIWCHVSRRKVPHDSDLDGNIKRLHRRTRQGVRKMLSCVTLTFLMSWLPLYVIVTRLKFANVQEKERIVLEILLPFAQWLGGWNSCINPVLYAFLNKRFREMFISLLPNWFPFVRSDACSKRNKEETEMRTFSTRSLGKIYRQLSCNTTPPKLSQKSNTINSSTKRMRKRQEVQNERNTSTRRSFRSGALKPNPVAISDVQVPVTKYEKQNMVVVCTHDTFYRQSCTETDL